MTKWKWQILMEYLQRCRKDHEKWMLFHARNCKEIERLIQCWVLLLSRPVQTGLSQIRERSRKAVVHNWARPKVHQCLVWETDASQIINWQLTLSFLGRVTKKKPYLRLASKRKDQHKQRNIDVGLKKKWLKILFEVSESCRRTFGRHITNKIEGMLDAICQAVMGHIDLFWVTPNFRMKMYILLSKRSAILIIWQHFIYFVSLANERCVKVWLPTIVAYIGSPLMRTCDIFITIITIRQIICHQM